MKGMFIIETSYSNEEWRDIPNYEGKYQISNYGRVKSLRRIIANGNGFYVKPEKILNPMMNYKGYLGVELQEKYHFIHRLVAGTFIPNPYNKPQVNHIDGNKENNYVANLEWVTNSENQIHAYKHGLNIHSEFSGRRKIPVEQININTNEVINIFSSIQEAEKETNIHHTNIIKVCKCQRKTAGGYIWRYVNE